MQESPTISNPQIVQPAVQIPVQLLQSVRSRHLTGTEYALWLYLYEVAPSGDFTDIPSPSQIATALNVDPRTIERAARRLEDLNLFTFQIQSWRVRNARVAAQNTTPISTVDFSLGKEIQMPTERSICPENNKIAHSPELLQNQDFKNFSTDDPVPEQINLNLKERTDLVKTNTPVLFDNKRIGTSFDALCKYIKEHGFDPNPAIRATLTKLFESLEPTDLQRRIDNAISAVQEQIRKGNLKRATPEPLLNAALQGRFTSNREKQKAKERRKAEPLTSRALQPPKALQISSSAPLASSPPVSQIDLVQLSLSIDDALFNGDRSFAYEKLCRLWQVGLEEVVREILSLRRDWGFRLGLNGPEEVSSATAPG